MYQFVLDLLSSFELGSYSNLIANITYIFLLALFSITVRFIIKYLLTKISTQISLRKKDFSLVIDNKLIERISNLSIPVTVSFLASELRALNILLSKSVDIALIITGAFVIISCIKSAGRFYASREISKTYPIRGFLQVLEISILIIAAIIAVSVAVEKSPAVLLGGIGAMTAVTTIVFKDAILGFVAGIQLTANDMIRIGDWIEIPKHSANGTVIDLSLTTAKVQNFDMSISQIPAYTLISESFINWRGMVDSGARRIKRPIYIDLTSVRICDNDLIARLQNNNVISDYLPAIFDNIENTDGFFTNVGIFSQYAVEYLNRHPKIHKGLTIMVRQLDTCEKGIPLEIYAFANTMQWIPYENIQSAVFNHFYAVIPQFDLKIYQSPSSYDFRTWVKGD